MVHKEILKQILVDGKPAVIHNFKDLDGTNIRLNRYLRGTVLMDPATGFFMVSRYIRTKTCKELPKVLQIQT